MQLSRLARLTLGTFTLVILGIIYVPLMVVLVNSFSTSTSLTWPPPDSLWNGGRKHSRTRVRWTRCGPACGLRWFPR